MSYLQQLSPLDSSSSARRFREFLVFQARRAASDLDFLRIRSVLATERPPTRGWGLPKFHSRPLVGHPDTVTRYAARDGDGTDGGRAPVQKVH